MIAELVGASSARRQLRATLPAVLLVLSDLSPWPIGQTVTPDEKYALKLSVEKASLIITNQTEPQINVTVTLTSPLMRDGAGDGGEWLAVHSRESPPRPAEPALRGSDVV